MKAVSVDSDNHVPVPSSEQESEEISFSSQEAFEQAVASWPGAKLVEIWNQIPGVQPVRKFTNRATALRRIWKAIQDVRRIVAAGGEIAAPQPQPARRAAKTAEPATGKTKTAKVIALLRRPDGATLAQIMKVTGWQAHSVRGFLSAQVSKRMGLRVRSFTRDGDRVYKVRG